MRSEDRERAFLTENAKLKAEIERLQKQKQSLLEEKAKLSAEKQRLYENRQATVIQHPVPLSSQATVSAAPKHVQTATQTQKTENIVEEKMPSSETADSISDALKRVRKR